MSRHGLLWRMFLHPIIYRLCSTILAMYHSVQLVETGKVRKIPRPAFMTVLGQK